MSAREFKAGDVVQARRFRGFCYEQGDELRVLYDDGSHDKMPDVVDARRLVVIDPESRDDVQQLATLFGTQPDCLRGYGFDAMQATLREFADPTPEPLAEPSTWGVVEASCVHSRERMEWVHHPDGNWWPAWAYGKQPDRTPLPDDWGSLIAPALVREGVTS